MITLPINAEMLALAPHIIWFEAPEKALADPVRFMAYLMTYGTLAHLSVVRKYVDEDGFAEALANAPPGIMDKRSWAYWNAMAGHYPTPPMPARVFPD
jgi:hypothetical protein